MPHHYPEHDKLRAVKNNSQTIGEFIEWLGQNGYYICEQRKAASDTVRNLAPRESSLGWERLGDAFCEILKAVEDAACLYWPTFKRLPNAILAQYFQIDESKLEAEKRQMLDDLRKSH